MTRRPRISTLFPSPPLSLSGGTRRRRHRSTRPDLYVGLDQVIPHDDRLARGIEGGPGDRKSTRLNSSHANISYAVFCLKKKKKKDTHSNTTHTCISRELAPS